MSGDVKVTSPDLDRWLADLSQARQVATVEAGRVVEKSALNVKNGWAKRWRGLEHAPALARAVTYDLLTPLSAEVGPDKELRQGALGNLVEFGSRNNAPIPGGAPALEDEIPRLVKNLARAVGASLIPGGDL